MTNEFDLPLERISKINIKEKINDKTFQKSFLDFCQKKGLNVFDSDQPGKSVFEIIADFNLLVEPMEAFTDRQLKEAFEKINNLLNLMEEFAINDKFSLNNANLMFNSLLRIYKTRIKPRIEANKEALVLSESANKTIQTIILSNKQNIADLIKDNPEIARLTLHELGNITSKLIINALPLDATINDNDQVEFSLNNQLYQVNLKTVPEFSYKNAQGEFEAITKLHQIKKLNLFLCDEYAKGLANGNLKANPNFQILKVSSPKNSFFIASGNDNSVNNNLLDDKLDNQIELSDNEVNNVDNLDQFIEIINNNIIKISSNPRKKVVRKFRLDENYQLEIQDNTKGSTEVIDLSYKNEFDNNEIVEIAEVAESDEILNDRKEFIEAEKGGISLLTTIRASLNTKVGKWATITILSLIGLGVKLGVLSDKKTYVANNMPQVGKLLDQRALPDKFDNKFDNQNNNLDQRVSSSRFTNKFDIQDNKPYQKISSSRFTNKFNQQQLGLNTDCQYPFSSK